MSFTPTEGMKLVYVAGKYRGRNDDETWSNIMVAREHALKLWKMGYAVICPHTNSIFMGHALPPEKDNFQLFISGDLLILSKCDYIYLLPGWTESEGAIIEDTFAIDHGIPRLSI